MAGLGDVVVGRDGPDRQGGYTWTVAVTQTPLLWPSTLHADSTGLTGLGARFTSTVLKQVRPRRASSGLTPLPTELHGPFIVVMTSA